MLAKHLERISYDANREVCCKFILGGGKNTKRKDIYRAIYKSITKFTFMLY